MSTHNQLMTVADHLREATDHLSELIASIDVERETVSRDSLIDAVLMHASVVMAEVWQARWALPFPTEGMIDG